MSTRFGWFFLTLVVGCTATGADRRGPASSDLEGSYAVTAYRSGACDGALTDSAAPYDWFELEVQDVVNVESLVLVPCESAESCSGSADDPLYFAEFDDFAASGETQTTSFDGQSCTFEWTLSTLDSDETGAVMVTTERSVVTGVDGIDIDDCFEQHDAFTGTRPCVGANELEGVLR